MRILIDSQSNPLFRGSPLEQSYGLRGGLCEGGKEDVVIVYRPFDPEYLRYWQSLGFDLPFIFVTKSDDLSETLSELIIKDNALCERLKALAEKNGNARLEFFCIEEPERELARHLGIKAYCNFDFSLSFSRKPRFRKFCLDHGIPVVEGEICRDLSDLKKFALPLFQRGERIIVKSEDGTGGIPCGGAIKIDPQDNLEQSFHQLKSPGNEFVAERIIKFPQEISIHWEITESGLARIIGIQDQISHNLGYSGIVMPSAREKDVLDRIKFTLTSKLIPNFLEMKAKGFFCCDVIVSPEEHWMDFNPRKGAALYVRKMTDRLKKIHFSHFGQIYLWHEHVETGRELSFLEVEQILGNLLDPCFNPGRLIVVTNSGVLPFGYVDLTAISVLSRDDAKSYFEKACNLILGTNQ